VVFSATKQPFGGGPQASVRKRHGIPIISWLHSQMEQFRPTVATAGHLTSEFRVANEETLATIAR
jgi:hypothetical protein